jgi:tRNA (guanine26-N2/guanine27-N2)-dimethyltransferase
MNDFNDDAIRLARRNARVNSVLDRCEFSCQDANVFLFSRGRGGSRIDYIDIDPFGSPSRYTQAALAASWNGTILSFTATDTPVLCGVHPRVSLRRYGSIPVRNDFKHELGIRILVHYCARIAATQDIGIEPVLVHSTRHYLRVYVRARRGALQADRAFRHFGYIVSCRGCGENSVDEAPIRRCPSCGAEVACAGPLWTGPLTDQGLVAKAASACSTLRFTEGERILSSLESVDDFPPTGYDLETVCSRLRIASVPPNRVMEALRDRGWSCIRHPFERSGIKTEATYKEVSEIVKLVANEP